MSDRIWHPKRCPLNTCAVIVDGHVATSNSSLGTQRHHQAGTINSPQALAPTFGDDVPPFYAWFIKRDRAGGILTHHIHMVEASFAEDWHRLLFRDYLIGHSGDCPRPRQLKLRLAMKHPHARIAYTAGKSEFIASVMLRAEGSVVSLRSLARNPLVSSSTFIKPRHFAPETVQLR